MLRALVPKGGSLQGQMSDVSTEMEIVGKNQKERLEIKNTTPEKKMKMPLMGL